MPLAISRGGIRTHAFRTRALNQRLGPLDHATDGFHSPAVSALPCSTVLINTYLRLPPLLSPMCEKTPRFPLQTLGRQSTVVSRKEAALVTKRKTESVTLQGMPSNTQCCHSLAQPV